MTYIRAETRLELARTTGRHVDMEEATMSNWIALDIDQVSCFYEPLYKCTYDPQLSYHPCRPPLTLVLWILITSSSQYLLIIIQLTKLLYCNLNDNIKSRLISMAT